MKQLSSHTSLAGKRWSGRLTSLGCLGAVVVASGCAPAPTSEETSLTTGLALGGAGEIQDFTGLGTEDFSGSNGDATEIEIGNCATWVAARGFDPTMLAVGPVNEWAGGDDNTTYNDTRQHYHDVLRAALGGHVLTTGPSYWKSRDRLHDPGYKFKTFDDLRVIYEWHEYSTLDAAGWQAEESKLAGWRDANGGRPTVCGEAGAGYWGDQFNGDALDYAPWAWPGLFNGMLPAIAMEAPSIWAVTYGGSYRINKSGGDPHLMDGSNGQPDLVQMFLDNEAAMRNVKGL